MKSKFKKKKLTIKEKYVEMIMNIVCAIKDLIDKSTIVNKNNIIEKINVILNIDKTCQEYDNLFVSHNKDILTTYKNELLQLEIYNIWAKSVLEFSIFLQKKYESFLTKAINCDVLVDTIIDNVLECLKFEYIFYTDCEQLDIINKNSEPEKINLLKSIKLSFEFVINFIKNDIQNNTKKSELSIDIVDNIVNLIKTNIVNKKFTEKGIFNWNVICTKINTYLKLSKPFDIYQIRQTDDVSTIANKMLDLLKDDKKHFSNAFIICDKNLVDYENELIKIKESVKYKNDNKYKKEANFILKRNTDKCVILTDIIDSLHIQIKQVTKDVKNIDYIEKNNVENQLKILSNMNHYILDNYQKIISYNTDLDIKTLQNKKTCFDYLKSFPLSSKWNDICTGVKNYLYWKNIKKMSSVGEYKSLKCKLKNIIKDESILQTINDHVKTIDKIVMRAYIFIKMYVLNLYEKKETLPDITDVDFISMVIRAITINDPKGANMNDNNKILLEKLELFYESHFKPIFGKKYVAIGLSQILGFVKIQMTTAYTNNITMNYVKYINNYMFSVFDSMFKDEYIKLDNKNKKEFKKELKKQINIGINDILDGNVCGTFENMKSKDLMKKWIIENINKIVPENTDYSKKGLENELEKNPMKFFEKMIYMNVELEKIQRKMFNCFPLRTSLVPSNIDIDTMSIITLFINQKKEEVDKQGISKVLKDNMTIMYDRIWGEIVDLNASQFKWNKQYKFDHHIITDGVEVTILFRHIDMINLDVHIKSSNKDTFKYIDKMGEIENGWDKELMKKEMEKMCALYTLLLIDPGKNPDLLYICNFDEDIKNVKYMKYTTKQRLHEMGTIKHRNILQNFKEGRKINEIEKKLTEVSSKTCVFKNFIIYAKNKNEVDDTLREHYNLPFIRKMRFRSHINKLRSESKLVNNIKSIFENDGKEIVLIYGDWSRNSQMRGVISTPCIGLKRRLAEDFKIFNIDEFRTSCLDNITLKKNKNAIVKSKSSGRKKELHSVLVSEILGKTVGKPLKRFQNRNRNSSLNMRNIIMNYKKEGERKLEFSRSYKLNINDDTDEKPNVGCAMLGNVLTTNIEGNKSGQNFTILKCNTYKLNKDQM